MYKVGDKVVVTKYMIPYLGEIIYVKGYSLSKEFYVVRFHNGTQEYLREEDLFLDNGMPI